MSSQRATPLAALLGFVASAIVLWACAPPATAGAPEQAVSLASEPTAGPSEAPTHAAPQALEAGPLDAYIAGVARAWEPYTTPDGRVEDPLDAADTGDNYGVILLADTMLKVAHRTSDSTLEGTGERIVQSALRLPVPNDPFNLLAIAAAIHDGEQGDFSASAWSEIAQPLEQRAGQIGPPSEASCLLELPCYDNWRLVWSAGAALLLADRVPGAPGSLAGDGVPAASQIEADLALAVDHAGRPLLTDSRAGVARELSDPGAEPPAYELFSTFMLELIGEFDPPAIDHRVAALRRQADRYALDMMAPDGQLSLSGRSLDESWVQAAAAALGARRATLEPDAAAAWRAFAQRAVSYLLAAYPLRANGLLPIVPGLSVEWNRSIVDGYAAFNQYEGLTLWLLSDALEQWPRPEAPRSPLPGDKRELLADDLRSSGLVWGRSGSVWWQLSGHSTSSDPRSAQGLVAVKLQRDGHWRDLLALRPRRHGLSSVWTLTSARGATATPSFARARGPGRAVRLSGDFRRAGGALVARTTWALTTTAAGVRVAMKLPPKDALRTTVWLPDPSTRLAAPGASLTYGTCTVTASGSACPVTITWRHTRLAVLEISAQ